MSRNINKELADMIPGLRTLNTLKVKDMQKGMQLLDAITTIEEMNVSEAIAKEGKKAENAHELTHEYKGILFAKLKVKSLYRQYYAQPSYGSDGIGLSMFEVQIELIKQKKIPDFMTPIFRAFIQMRGE